MAFSRQTRPWLWAAFAALLLLACLGGPAASTAAAAAPAARGAIPANGNQAYGIPYFSWNHRLRMAIVVLPRDYVPGASTEALPCIIQLRGRQSTVASAAATWGSLPTERHFIVICPESVGRRDPVNSWGVPGQIQDILDMPDVVESTVPWVHVDRTRLYVVGVSMGGQEALSAAARFPDRVAAAISVDGVADLAARYRELPRVGRKSDQRLMRLEVGGTPRTVPFKYAVRSPMGFAGGLATDGVPVGIWWSQADRLVINQATTQTGRLYANIMAQNPAAPVVQLLGDQAHGVMLRNDPGAALDFLAPGGAWRTVQVAPPASWQYQSWLPDVSLWRYRFTTWPGLTAMWGVAVAPGSVSVTTPAPMTATLPYDASLPAPATVVLNGAPVSVQPVAGTLTLSFPAGQTTALIDP
ncbi:MAG TPA: alpha/beta fold hydrolase [Thermoleophilia bacterium]|nr:alpha/beta fold hydrolase [Thermoleophilia bacterium]